MRVLFPEPDTPVTQVMQLIGISKETLFRLFLEAFLTLILLIPLLLVLGVSTFKIPLIYLFVIDLEFLFIF